MTSRCRVDPTRSTTRATQPSDLNSKRLSLRTSVAREETSDSIQVDLVKRLRSLCYDGFIHTYRTLKCSGVTGCRLVLIILGNHGREESKLLSLLKHWEIRLPPPRKGLEVRRLADSFHGLPAVFNCQSF